MSLPRIAVKHPVSTTMVFLALFVLGVISIWRVGMEFFPDVNLPSVAVVTTNPGAAAREMETDVTIPVEDAMAVLSGVDSIRSESRESASIVRVSFVEGTDVDALVPELRERLNAISNDLPEDAERPVVEKFDASDIPSLTATMTGTLRGMDLRRLAMDEVVPRLQQVEGVAQVSVSGGIEEVALVELSVDALASYGVSISRILQVFQAENVNLPAGSVRLDDRQVSLRALGEFESLTDIEEVVVGSAGSSTVRIKDIGSVSLDHLPPTEIVRAGSGEAVLLSIRKQPGFNTVDVNTAVRARLESLRSVLPPSVAFEIQNDQAEDVRDAVGGVATAAWQGALLAVLVLLFFLRNVRSTAIISTTIPVAVIATFTLFDFAGMTLNVVSLMGITLAIGMFVDNAIVVLESIYRKQLAGFGPEEAAVVGAEEVSRAISASTLTTIAVFGPMLYLEGITGIIFDDLSLTVAFSIVISLLSALTLIPVLCAKFLRVSEHTELAGNAESREEAEHELSLADAEIRSRSAALQRVLDWIKTVLKGLDTWYESALNWSLDHGGTVVVSAVLLLAVSVASVLLLGLEFLPESDEGKFSVHFETRLDAPYDATTAKAVEIEEIVRDVAGAELETMATEVGDGGSNLGRVSATLTGVDERDVSIWQVINRVDDRVRREVLDIEYTISIDGISGLARSSTGESTPIIVELTGEDLDALMATAREIEAEITGTPGTRNVRADFTTGKPELQFVVDKRQAANLGISPRAIAAGVRTAYNGAVVSSYTRNDDTLDVVVILAEDDRRSQAAARRLVFRSPGGTVVPLESVVTLRDSTGPVSITRKDRTRIVRVLAELTGEYPLSTVQEGVEERVAAVSVPPTVELELAGSSAELATSFESLFFALALAVILVYMVMAAQFESFIDPLIVMFSVPFAVIGLVGILLVTASTFSVLAFIGAILLVGIVVNNAIVLIDYIKLLGRRGVDLRTAIVSGGRVRLKPILMTSLTTILAILPMALGIGPGAELRAPLGKAVVGGLTTSTLITLVLIPTGIWLVETRLKRRGEGAAEEGADADKTA